MTSDISENMGLKRWHEDNFQKLERVNIALDTIGVPLKGRGRLVVDKTKYSQGMVSRFFNGKDVLNDRFIKTLCRAFGINEEYIQKGTGGVYSDGFSIKSENYNNEIHQKIHDAIVESFFPTILDMTESELYHLYADFLECDRLQLVKKNGETITIYQNTDSDLVNK